MAKGYPSRYRTYLGWKSSATKGMNMVAVISAVVGLAVGVAVTWTYMMKRSQSLARRR